MIGGKCAYIKDFDGYDLDPDGSYRNEFINKNVINYLAANMVDTKGCFIFSSIR